MNVTNVNRADRIYKGWLAVEICGLMAVLILFNAFPQWVGILVSADNLSSFVPLITPEFQVYMPWLNLCWGLALGLAYVELFYGRWTLALRAADLGLCALGILVLCRFLFGGPIVGLNSQAISSLSPIVKATLWLALVGSIVTLFRKLARIVASLPTAESGKASAIPPEHT